MLAVEIAFEYDDKGEVRCSNPKGLTFFLFADATGPKPTAATAPSAPAPAWKAMEATKEVEVRRGGAAQPLKEQPRPLPPEPANFQQMMATQEVEVRRVVPMAEPPAPIVPSPLPVRGTAPLSQAPSAGEAPQKGWFNRLFAKH